MCHSHDAILAFGIQVTHSEVLHRAVCCKAQDPLNHPGAALAMHVVAGLHQATWASGLKVGYFCHDSLWPLIVAELSLP